MNDNVRKILEYVGDNVIEKHKTCLTNTFDNGYFWAMKELQSFILKECDFEEDSTDET